MPCMFQEFRDNSEESKRRGQHLFAVRDAKTFYALQVYQMVLKWWLLLSTSVETGKYYFVW